VSPLFGKSEDKAAREEAGRVEFERLTALPVADLALELMPAFGPDGPRGRGPEGAINIVQLLSWVSKTNFPDGVSYARKLNDPVREGVQALEGAGLVLATRHQQGQWLAATRLGQTALADGTVRDHLVGQPSA
jgi:hypothetical protein